MKILKILLITFFLSLNFIYASVKLSLGNETKVYDKIFDKVSETRIGVEEKVISKLKNPFLVIYKKRLDSKKPKKPKIIYTLDGIFDNKAKINGKWRKKYTKIGVYKIVKIKRRSVILRNSNGTKELFIRKNNVSKIKFSSK
ncbi:MAG: hypothetical protein GXP61_09190 [Epsilonproteobacteria bacterium]|nr:hypothetical protein [Campylobacterota bacterium]